MTEQYIRYAAMFIIIMMAVIDDYRRFKVSNRIIIAGMVIGVVINMGSLMYGGDVRGYIYGGMAGFAIMYMVYIFGGVGAGDVKLLAVCGLLIGVTYIVCPFYQIQNRIRPLRHMLFQSETGVFSFCPFQTEHVLSALDFPFFPAS